MNEPIYKWWHHATIYEIYPKSFTGQQNGEGGNLQGIISKLPYLSHLGIDALWLCPVFGSPFKDSGYDVSDYKTINDDFGTIEDLEELMAKAHELKMKIILDMVINHTSDEHPWFISACQSLDSPYRDYYIFRDQKDGQYPNNWISSKTLSSVWTYNPVIGDYYLHIYTKHQPDLNWENRQLREEIYDMLRFWLNKGVDGFRLDVINKLAKKKDLPDYTGDDQHPYADSFFENNDQVHGYIKEMHKEVFDDYPEALIMGQTAGITTQQAYEYVHPSRHELNLYLQFEHMDIDRGYEGRVRDWTISDLYNSVMKWQLLSAKGLWPTVFFGSHDSARMVPRYGNVSKAYHLLSAKMLCVLQLCLAGTQVLYMGDELGLCNVEYENIDDFTDIRSHDIYRSRRNKGESKASILKDLREVARDNARVQIPWLLAEDMIEDDHSIYNFYRKMIQFRKASTVLLTGQVNTLILDNDHLFAYSRRNEHVIMTVIANMSSEEVTLTLDKYGVLVIDNYEEVSSGALKAYEVKVFRYEG